MSFVNVESSSPSSSEPSSLSVSTIKYGVVGVGGAGSRIVRRLELEGALAIARMVVDCDQQELHALSLPQKFLVGRSQTRGLGSGGDIEVARQALMADREEIMRALQGVELLFVVAGLGGGMGSAGAPLIAQWARECGARVIAMVALPFTFEGGRRSRTAEEGLNHLRQQCHVVIPLPNDLLLQQMENDAGVDEAFAQATLWIQGGICSIWSMLERKGAVSLDLAAFKNAFPQPGFRTLFSIAEVSGDGWSERVVESLLQCPLLDVPEYTARFDHLLVNLIGGPDMGMSQVNEIISSVAERFCSRENTRFGVIIEPERSNSLQICVLGSADLGNERYRKKLRDAANREEEWTGENGGRKKNMPSTPAVDFQGEFDFANQSPARGYFDDTGRNMWEGQDLDIPTYLRRGVKIPQ